MKLERRRIRIAADATKAPDYEVKDIFTAAKPAVWRGNDLQIEIGIHMAAALVTDISNFASLTVRILSDSTASAASLVSKTLSAGDLNGSLTAEQWSAGTHQHATVSFSGEETSPVLGSSLSKQFWMVVSGVTNDSPGRAITLCATTITIYEDGEGSEISTPEQAALIYNRQESDARYLPRHEDGSAVRYINGRFYHYEPITDLWYPQVAVIKDGVAVLALGPGETLP
jgi:hypothetical protein